MDGVGGADTTIARSINGEGSSRNHGSIKDLVSRLAKPCPNVWKNFAQSLKSYLERKSCRTLPKPCLILGQSLGRMGFFRLIKQRNCPGGRSS